MTDFSPSRPLTQAEAKVRRRRFLLIGAAIVALIVLGLALAGCDTDPPARADTNITVVDETILDNAVDSGATGRRNDDGSQP